MSLPNTEITISKKGTVTVRSLEQSTECYKLKDFARKAGSVTQETDKDHPPVHQKINIV